MLREWQKRQNCLRMCYMPCCTPTPECDSEWPHLANKSDMRDYLFDDLKHGEKFPDFRTRRRCSACVFIQVKTDFELGCAGKFASSEPLGDEGSLSAHQLVAKVNRYLVLFFVKRKNELEFSSFFVRNRYETVVLTNYNPLYQLSVTKKNLIN
jgi:hypothetical protein